MALPVFCPIDATSFDCIYLGSSSFLDVNRDVFTQPAADQYAWVINMTTAKKTQHVPVSGDPSDRINGGVVHPEAGIDRII